MKFRMLHRIYDESNDDLTSRPSHLCTDIILGCQEQVDHCGCDVALSLGLVGPNIAEFVKPLVLRVTDWGMDSPVCGCVNENSVRMTKGRSVSSQARGNPEGQVNRQRGNQLHWQFELSYVVIVGPKPQHLIARPLEWRAMHTK